MPQSSIMINVELDENKIPANIRWQATDSAMNKPDDAKAMILSLWDGADKAVLRIDLWTKDMMVDEMADFFYQTLMTMADTYRRATQSEEEVAEIKSFAASFIKKAREKQRSRTEDPL